MADDTQPTGASPLPPKLDLRRSGILKPTPPASPGAVTAASPGTPAAPAVPIAVSAPRTPAPVAPAAPASAPAPKPVMGGGSTAPTPGAQPAWRAKPVVPGARPAGIGGSPVAPRPVMGAKPAPVQAASRPVATTPTLAGIPVAAPAAIPLAAPVSATAPIVLGAPVSKKETSRIPLTAAKPRPELEEDEEYTARTSAPSAVRVIKANEPAPLATIPTPSEVTSAEKRKTSRISLDAVMGDSKSDTDADSGMKTIRLKRPGEASTIKVSPAAPKADDAGAPGSAQTQRKTVVVKRTAESAGARKLSVARPAATAASAESPLGGGPMGQFLVAAPEPHWSFGVVAIAATLVACVCIYLFCSQAVGPNSAKTLYSYWPGGPDLMWPGKVSGQY